MQDLSSPSRQFNLLDVNGDGKLSRQEVISLISELKYDILALFTPAKN